jgi:hypothetical protein
MSIKNYIGISRDHSASMRSIATAAARDFNSNIQSIRDEAIAHNQDTIVSVIKCGFREIARGGYGYSTDTKNVFDYVNSNILAVTPIPEREYNANGNNTPLFDSVGELIESFKKVPDANDPDVSFLIMVITDGEDNASRKWSGASIGQEIRKLQSTDRWTFVFRVPRGYKRQLVSLGIPDGNILEWEQTERGVQAATQATTQAMRSFYSGRASGQKSTSTFYADLSNVSAEQVKATLTDISPEISIWPVLPQEDGVQVRDFCEKRLGNTGMLKGAAFYELTKREPKVQDYKQIVIRDKSSKMIYGGSAARDMLGLPHVGDVKLAPGNHGNFDIFVQSTSVNRKLPAGSSVLYWPKVGVAFTEGPSAGKK